jgi:hypothetical protein
VSSNYQTYDYSEVKTFLRTWPHRDQGPCQSDFVGTMHLFLAVLENLSTNSEEFEVESLGEVLAEDNERILSKSQREFLELLLRIDNQFALDEQLAPTQQ